MDDTLRRLAGELDSRAPLTMDSTLEDFAGTIRLCVAFEVLDCPGMSEADITRRALETALDGATLTERLRLVVTDAVRLEVRRQFQRQQVAA